MTREKGIEAYFQGLLVPDDGISLVSYGVSIYCFSIHNCCLVNEQRRRRFLIAFETGAVLDLMYEQNTISDSDGNLVHFTSCK